MHDEDVLTNHSYGSAYPSSSRGGYTGASPSEIYDSSSSSYYTPAQTSSSYYSQDSAWSSQYANSSNAGYDSSYYSTAGTPVTGQAYDASYYAGNSYAGYSQQGTWRAVGDTRAFVGSGTTYDALNDLPIDSSRRNAELLHYCEQQNNP